MYNDNNNYGFPSDYCTEASNANMGSNVATIATVIARAVLRYALGDTQIGDIEGDALKYRLDALPQNFTRINPTYKVKLYVEPKKVKVEEKTIQELVCCVLISPRDCSAVSNLFDITYADSYGNQIPAEGYQKQFSKFFQEKIVN